MDDAVTVKKRTSIELAYERLRDELLTCGIMPEDRLKITDIAARFGVSPPSVREALSRLLSENLVTFVPLKGFKAAPISCEASRDLLTARVEIESACFRLSIEHGDKAWEQAVSVGHKALLGLLKYRGAVSIEALRDAQRLFLDALVAGCHNRTLLQIRANLLEQSQRYLNLAWRFAPPEHDFEAEHHALLETALARDASGGAEAIENYILLTRQWILDAMNSDAWINAMSGQSRRKRSSLPRVTIQRQIPADVRKVA